LPRDFLRDFEYQEVLGTDGSKLANDLSQDAKVTMFAARRIVQQGKMTVGA
jgi:hypothetical protein